MLRSRNIGINMRQNRSERLPQDPRRTARRVRRTMPNAGKRQETHEPTGLPKSGLFTNRVNECNGDFSPIIVPLKGNSS